MKVKNGIDSSRSFEMMPKNRNGSACKNTGSKCPVKMPRIPKNSPTAGNPINMKQIMVPNIKGGMTP